MCLHRKWTPDKFSMFHICEQIKCLDTQRSKVAQGRPRSHSPSSLAGEDDILIHQYHLASRVHAVREAANSTVLPTPTPVRTLPICTYLDRPRTFRPLIQNDPIVPSSHHPLIQPASQPASPPTEQTKLTLVPSAYM